MADEVVNTHEKIRVGNDIGVRWTLIDGDGQPYNFDGRDVYVEIDINNGKKHYRVKDLTHDANTLIFTYWGKDQKHTGICSLKFVENDGEQEMVTFDIPNAFEMVPHSWLTGTAPDNERVQLSFVTLTSNLVEKIGPPGQDAGFGEIVATVDAFVGTPSVEVTTSGPNTAKNITFAFHNLKGDPGEVENLTAAMIREALGYTPADENDIPKIKTLAKQDIEGEGDVVTDIVVSYGCLCAPVSAYFSALLMNSPGETVAIWDCRSNTDDRLIAFGDNSFDCLKSQDYHGVVFNNAYTYRILVLGANQKVEFSTRTVNSLTLPVQHFAVQQIYYKPSSGIPKRDLVDAVQTSLGKADSAVQPAALESYYTKSETDEKISTSTAEFRGTSAAGLTEQQFLAWANGLTKNLNDYCFWNTTDAAGNKIFKRYKYNGTTWLYEYELESTQLTAAEWAAVNSGITAEKVAAHDAMYTKPSSGIPASDLASGVIPEISTDISSDATSDTKTASPKAVKTYVDNNSAPDAIKYTAQALTSGQQAQARTNIGAGTYTKPATGIPSTDLAEGVIPETIESAEVSVDANTGTPSASASVSGGVLSLEFHNLKGETGGTGPEGPRGPQGLQGNTGSSVDYPYELVNNCTTDDATKGLSAAQGVVLEGEISQLGQEIDEKAKYSSSTSAGSFGNSNKYIAVANGSEQSSSGYKSSNLYPLENIDSIVYSIYSGASTVAVVAFYQTTDRSSYISGIGGVNQLYAGTLAKSDIPANAKYVAFSCKTASGTSSFSLIRTTTVRDTLENVNSRLDIRYDTIYSATPTVSSLKTVPCDIHPGQLYRVTIKGTPVASKYVTIATGTSSSTYEYIFNAAEPTAAGITVIFYPLVSAELFRVYSTQTVEVTIEKGIDVQEYLATPLDARNNIESVSNAGNILGLDNSVTFFDNILLNANVNDAGTVISGGSDYYRVAYKAVSKNDIITILSDSTSSTIPSFVLWYSSSKPTMGSTGLAKQLAKGTYGTPTHIIAEWVAPADGYLAITYHATSAVYFAIYQKEGFSNTVSTYVPEKIQLELTKQNAIEADVDSESYGESVSITSSSYGVTDYIDIEGAKFISMYMRYSTATFGDIVSCPGSVFYDSSKNPIGVARIFNRSLRTYTVWGTIAVPDNAKYIRVTEYIYSDAHIDVYRKLASDCNDEIDQLKMFVEGVDKNVVRQALYVASSPTVKSLGLLHLSDIHGDAEAANRISAYINNLRAFINDIICTGDSVHYYADSSTTYPNGSAWWAASDLAKESLFVLGNHDGATSAGTSYDQKEDSAAWDGKGKAWDFETYFAPFISDVGYVMPTGYDDSSSPNYQACYWHKDYADQKIRVIGLDCMHRFDGILDPATGEITSAGLKHTTNEQELWLISKLNETLNSSNAAYGYSVIICCHYPLDDFSGNNETWNDSAHRWQYNNNESGGRVVDYKTGEATNFHWANIETFTAELKFNMRNRVSNGGQSTTSPNYTKGSTNNVANIISSWMTQGGKFIAWLCGHVHCDFMWYSTNYPNILCVAIDQAGNLRGTNTGNRSAGTSSRACANFYAIDTQNGLFKIVRFGYNMNRLLNSHKYLCYDYINKKVLNEG